MQKSTHTPEYTSVMAKLITMRKAKGMTQRQLAGALDREQSFVWRIEKGERRLDIVEFFWVCNALGNDAATVYNELCKTFRKDPA